MFATKALAKGPHASPTLGTHPDFSSPNADVVLRSSDDMLFRVSSDVLSRASGWLKTMFTLPQDPTVGPPEPILMSEPASILVILLSIADGRALPSLNHSDDLELLLVAAEKYEMPLAISVLRLAFSSRLNNMTALRLYGIACRMGWEEEAKDASSRTLTQSLFASDAQVELAAMESRHRDLLIDLHRLRREGFLNGLDDTTRFDANILGGPCSGYNFKDGKPCLAPLDHSHWWALKYALMRRWVEHPFDERLDETFYRMREVKEASSAKCHRCDKTLYEWAHTVTNINSVIQALPRCVEVGSLCINAEVLG